MAPPPSIDALLSNGVNYAPTANYNGGATLTVSVHDVGGATDSEQVAITVNSVNDAPAGTNKTISATEDTAYAFTAADFGFSDPNDGPANALAAVKIATLPGAGTLTNNGVAVAANQFVSIADINAGHLVFTPAANANGTGYASFTFQVRDNGGVANGGVNLDPTPNTITVDVTAVNDAPVLTVPGNSASVDEDGSLELTGAQLVDVDWDDVDHARPVGRKRYAGGHRRSAHGRHCDRRRRQRWNAAAARLGSRHQRPCWPRRDLHAGREL